MENTWRDELPEQRERRLAMCACLNVDVAFRGIGMACAIPRCISRTTWAGRVVLSLPVDGLIAEKIADHFSRGSGRDQSLELIEGDVILTRSNPSAVPSAGHIQCPMRGRNTLRGLSEPI